jgi:hypothetical protein
MGVHVDEMTSQVDVEMRSASTSGGAAPGDAARTAQRQRAARARVAELEARTRAEKFDD